MNCCRNISEQLPAGPLPRRRATLCATLFLLMFVASTSAEQQNKGSSGSGQIEWQLREGAEESKRIWLAPRDRPNEAVELCETHGWGNLSIHFSPDDSWLIVQDGGGSLGISLRLFKREKGLRFKELEEADINGKVERAALVDAGAFSKDPLDHLYASVLGWSADSRTVLVRVAGSGSRNNRQVAVEGWTGVYDLASGAISLDLKKFNRQAVKETKAGTQ
jgi:hypothetical protein